jgi:transcriptional regulator with XRE-family HTH domain
MSERSKRISNLLSSGTSRASYIRAKLNVLIPSQIRALRLRRENMTQKELAELAQMAQPRISAMERPGATKFNIETLVRLASAFKVGLRVEFVPFSEMLNWENEFSQDEFDATVIDRDTRFLHPSAVVDLHAGTAPISQEVLTVARFNFTYGTQTVQTAIGEVWNLPVSGSQQASAALAPVELVAAAVASSINVYSGASQDAD